MKQLILLFLLISIGSCADNVDKPKNLVSEKIMAEILSEISLYQQSSYTNEINGFPLDYGKMNISIIEKHNVKFEDFDQSYKYYVNSPELYNKILYKSREILENQLPEADKQHRQNIRNQQ